MGPVIYNVGERSETTSLAARIRLLHSMFLKLRGSSGSLTIRLVSERPGETKVLGGMQ
jgi:hypothetical protein